MEEKTCEKIINITKHYLVPKHEVLSAEDVEKLLANYKIGRNQLPKILSSDPVAQVLKAKLGDVLKITRPSATAGETVYYRVVID